MLPVYNLQAKIKAALLVSSFVLLACAEEAPNQEPIPAVSSATNGQAGALRELELELLNPDLKGIAEANVLLWLPGEAKPNQSQARQTDQQGQLLLSDLEAGQAYLLQVSAKGYRPLRKFIYGPRLAEPPMRQRLSLQPAQRLAGRVTDTSGQALAAVHIQQGQYSVLSNAKGEFELWGTESETIVAFKQGYQKIEGPGQTFLATDAFRAELSLSAADSPLRLRWDDRYQALGLSAAEFQAQAAEALQQSPRQVLPWSAADLEPTRDLLWLAYPTQNWDAEQSQALLDFVSAGGQLILTGEWAGFGLSINDSLQDWLTPLGLQLGQDTLAQTEDSLKVNQWGADPLVEDLSAIQLARSGSLQIVELEQAHCLAYAPAAAYRIASLALPQCVLARSLSGLGQVISLSDSSLWLSEFGSADNAVLWQRLMGSESGR